MHPPCICALLQFLEVPHQHWPLAVESTVLASVNPFYFLHRLQLGGPSEGGLCATGRDCAEQETDDSDSSDLEELRASKGKRGSPWSSSAGVIPQWAPKLLNRSSQTIVYPGRVPLISAAGSAKNRVPDISSPSCQNNRLGTEVHRQCPRSWRSRQGNRLRLPLVSAHGMYDTNDP